MKTLHPTPSKEEIALLPEFPRLPINRITLVSTESQAIEAREALLQTRHWGFDTESKPTFVKDQASDGPHILQLSTLDKAWVFQLHDLACRGVAAQLLALPSYTKAGFGLGDDRRRIIHKLGVDPADVLELNTVFQARGYRKDMGIKGGIAVLFNQRFAKSKKAATSNWSMPQLTQSQLTYAANDAYGAIHVFHALGLN